MKKTLHIPTYSGLLCHFATHITAVPLHPFRFCQIIYVIALTEGMSDITLFLLGFRKAHCNFFSQSNQIIKKFTNVKYRPHEVLKYVFVTVLYRHIFNEILRTEILIFKALKVYVQDRNIRPNVYRYTEIGKYSYTWSLFFTNNSERILL